MAAAVYATDLVTINLVTGGWNELTGATGGRITDADSDNFIAGTASTTSQARVVNTMSMAAPTSTITVASGDAAFFWFYHGAMPSISTFALDGYQAVIGNTTANYKRWTVHGSDTLPKGGWFSIAIDPTAPQTNVQGSPSSVTAVFGSRINQIVPVAKGNPYANDYIRHGRSLIVDLGDVPSPAKFAAAATENDLVANKWGLFEKIAGGFSQKGLFQMGTATNAVRFVDSNVNISVEDTFHCAAGFNEFEVINSASVVDWTGVQISALGTVARGNFTVTDNATVTKTGCTFNDMGTFSYLSNSTLSGVVYRRCNAVTQGGASITTCTFEGSTGAQALVSTAATLSSVTDNSFVSSGTGYAVDLGTTTDITTITWNNVDTGYAATDGTTGNETIHITYNGASPKDISVAAGASTPTVHNSGTGTVTVTAGQVTFKIIVKDNFGALLTTLDANVLVEAAAGGSLAVGTDIVKGFTDVNGEIQDIRSYATNQPITGWVRKMSVSPIFKQGVVSGTIDTANGLTITIQLVSDE